jgi:ABC-type tungstate transport system substrate-binding protein
MLESSAAMMKMIAFGVGLFSASIAAFAFVAFLLSLVMCFREGWGPQGPMDPGWGIVAILTAAICFVTGIIGLLLLMPRRRKKFN